MLMRIENIEARSFYEIECVQQQWSLSQLRRQVGSSLYERLALSRNKDEVMRLALEGQTIEKPADIIKNPMTLEFLGLRPEAAYTESKLENAIISKLQTFLLEMGEGFLLRRVRSASPLMSRTTMWIWCRSTAICVLSCS